MGIGSEDQTAFAFDGNWKEFAPIALSNSLLTLVTLGFYRFWAITRERQYLWRHSRFIDDTLEWTGTGREIFSSFILVFGAFLILSFFVSFVPFLLIVLLPLYFWVIGVAKFRGIRYRLSRTRWHGIRGGSNDNGVAFGFTYVWKSIAGALPFMQPWAMTNLWNDRWNKMSFGQHDFRSNAHWSNVFGKYCLSVFAPTFMLLPGVFLIGAVGAALGPDNLAISSVIVGLLTSALFIGLAIFPLIFYAAFIREVMDKLEFSSIEFEFSARTKDWLLLYLGHIGLWTAAALPGILIAASLGLYASMTPEALRAGDIWAKGAIILTALTFVIPLIFTMPFIRYRNWRFFITFLEARGEINLAELIQSETSDESRGEGLLDALDIGAI